MTEIEKAKFECKMIKKHNNPDNLPLMKIQHQYAIKLGYRSWKEFIDKKGEQNGESTSIEK